MPGIGFRGSTEPVGSATVGAIVVPGRPSRASGLRDRYRAHWRGLPWRCSIGLRWFGGSPFNVRSPLASIGSFGFPARGSDDGDAPAHGPDPAGPGVPPASGTWETSFGGGLTGVPLLLLLGVLPAALLVGRRSRVRLNVFGARRSSSPSWSGPDNSAPSCGSGLVPSRRPDCPRRKQDYRVVRSCRRPGDPAVRSEDRCTVPALRS